MTYYYDDFELTVHFSDPNAKLPIKLKNGQIGYLRWGRHQKEKGELPLGGWAKLSTIYAGRWNCFQPKPVKIPASRFMEEDHERRMHWFNITSGLYIQGLVATLKKEKRVYVVTITPTLTDINYTRWPRIITSIT